MIRRYRIAAVLTAVALTASGCGGRTYGRGLRRLAPFGLRAGWVDLRDFKLTEVEDRPLVGFYLRNFVKGRAVIELGADAALELETPDEHPLYSAGLSVLYFPTRRGGIYLHAGGGGIYEVTPTDDYLQGHASVGAGYTLPAGITRVDLRASFWKVIDSANAKSALIFTAGYGF